MVVTGRPWVVLLGVDVSVEAVADNVEPSLEVCRVTEADVPAVSENVPVGEVVNDREDSVAV